MKKNLSAGRIVKLLLVTLILLNSISNLYAQQRPKAFGKPVYSVNPSNGFVRCVSSEYEDYQHETNIKGETQEQFEAWMGQKLQQTKAQRSANGTTQIITIPVVVHVIHNGDNVGSNENIATAQVLSQITVLNQDFRKMAGTPGDNDEQAGADVEIEFCLAQVDPAGNTTNGIDRVNLGRPSWNSMDEIDAELKPQTIWDPEQYFNIWVCNYGGQAEEILGYAQFPNTNTIQGIGTNNGGADTDGVVIGYRFFGSALLYPQGVYAAPYNRGRTATHEVGHALGLRHIWGDGGNRMFSILNCNATDYCDDTPFAGWDNYECDGTTDTCPAKPGLDMTNNYMDYTNDICMNTFTQDQKLRMITVMNNAPRRASLKTSGVWQPLAASKDFGLLNGISLYPNPAQTVINIAIENGELPDSYTIYNSLGQTIAHVKVTGSTNLAINTSAYAQGVYFIKIEKGIEGKTLRFIKD